MSEREIIDQLQSFDSISLKEMDRVKLMNRIDTKFAFDKNTLIQILPLLKTNYFSLEIEGKRALTYESLYFDDADFSLFHDHHNRRVNRYKFRIRNYVESNLFFFEIKHKIKGRTDKHRIATDGFHKTLSPEERAFLKENTHKLYELIPVLTNRFKRITLVNKVENERLTLDFNLIFNTELKSVELSELVIAELKQQKLNRRSPFYQLMKSLNLRPYRLSKYCIGAIELIGKEHLKFNRFKRKLMYLEKINNHAT
jgi:hypothetical protein